MVHRRTGEVMPRTHRRAAQRGDARVVCYPRRLFYTFNPWRCLGRQAGEFAPAGRFEGISGEGRGRVRSVNLASLHGCEVSAES
jgi:hypothetical protein